MVGEVEVVAVPVGRNIPQVFEVLSVQYQLFSIKYCDTSRWQRNSINQVNINVNLILDY